MWQIETRPVKRISGEVTVPGDKSISHRAVLFGALTNGRVEIDNYLQGEDCLNTIEFVRRLGVQVSLERNPNKVTVHGVGFDGLKEPGEIIDVGNAGTLIRIGAGLLAACPFFTVVTGDASIRQRPMGRVVEPLELMGARIMGRAVNTLAPLAISGGGLHGITYAPKAASAQVKSAVLLAGLLADAGETIVKEPVPTRDHTERMLSYLGADVAVDGNSVRIKPQRTLEARPILIPGDISSAAFVLAAALLRTDEEVLVRDIGYNPTRGGIIQILQQMGGDVRILHPREVNGEPVADILVRPSQLRAIHLGGEIIPNIIDEIPVLAILATQAEGQTVISDAAELRVKESDRIRTTVASLQKLGADIVERPDGMIIEGPVRLHGGAVESYGDHRIAMALAIAGLVADGSVTIADTACTRTSFPGFVALINALTGETALVEREVIIP